MVPVPSRIARRRPHRDAGGRALDCVTSRHQTLNTFTRGRLNGTPVEIEIGTRARYPPLSIEDLEKPAEVERRNEAGRRAEEEARRPLDLARGLLLL